jgi:hypothetical protein
VTLVLRSQLDDGSQLQARQEQCQRLQADLSGKNEQLTIQTRRLWEADEQSQRRCAPACTVARFLHAVVLCSNRPYATPCHAHRMLKCAESHASCISHRDKELQEVQAELRKRDAALQQAQQRTQDDALQLAQRDEQISRLHEQALLLEKECALSANATCVR